MHIENLTVFIIDDDAQVRDSIALMLGLMGFRTVVFDSAEAFLAAYKADWAGCVIVDLRLPGQSGLELQQELLALNSALPVVVITAHGDVATARAAFQANAVDFSKSRLTTNSFGARSRPRSRWRNAVFSVPTISAKLLSDYRCSPHGNAK